MRYFQIVLFVLMIVAAVDMAAAIDGDNNGVHDDVEFAIIEKFKPAFVLHAGRHQEPERVEILSGTEYLDNYDLWVYSARLDGEFNFDDYLYIRFPDAMNLEIWQWPHAKALHYDDQHYYHLEYGTNFDQDPASWQDLYYYGGGDVLPGSAYGPTTYAHVFLSGPYCIIQYWFFYPYNDWVVNHEGDWEHINVILSGDFDDPDSMYVRAVDYYFHEAYMNIEINELHKLYILDETHPVVFVGGYGWMNCLDIPQLCKLLLITPPLPAHA